MMNYKTILSDNPPENIRIDLIYDVDCPYEIKEIIVKYDVAANVIIAAANNIDLPKALRDIAINRLSEIKTSKKNSTLCPIPWNHVAIQQNGDFRICCEAIYGSLGKLEKDGIIANINNTTLDEVRNLQAIKDLRVSMVNGTKHETCRQCWDYERLGIDSKRTTMLKIYGSKNLVLERPDGSIDTKKYPIKYMDIRFGNLCNLVCRMCSPSDSSLWVEDAYKMSGGPTIINFYGKKEYKIDSVKGKIQIVNDSTDFNWGELDNFWHDYNLFGNNIDRLYFTGGEPTINKAHFRLLDQLVNTGKSKFIKLEYNSNMVAIPDKLFTLWQNFLEVGVGCSIDGIGDYANYIRPPSNWQVLESNLDKIGNSKLSNLHGTISTTISVYNIINFLDLTRWLLSKKYTNMQNIPNFHMLIGPKQLNVQILPESTKKTIRDTYEKFYVEIESLYGNKLAHDIRIKYAGIINHMFAKDMSELLPEFKKFTEKIDILKNQSLEKTINWLWKISSN